MLFHICESTLKETLGDLGIYYFSPTEFKNWSNIHKQFPFKKQTPTDTARLKSSKEFRGRVPLVVNTLSASLALGGVSAITLITLGDLLNAISQQEFSHLISCNQLR